MPRCFSRLAVRRTALPLTLSISALLLHLSCVDVPTDPAAPEGYGMIELRARVVNSPLSKAQALSGADAVSQTLADTVVVEVSGSDLSPTRIKRKLDLSRPSVIDTVAKIPVGKNRQIKIWAIDRGGHVTHIDSVESRTANIESAVVTPVFVTLIPAAGSIYLQLTGLAPEAAAVYASFASLDEELVSENRVAKAARTFLSLDNIPHDMLGILRISILDAVDDTIQISTERIKFNARGDNNISLQFVENSGMLKMDVSIYATGVMSGAYNFKNSESVVEETGELIITEIMWNAGNDNYLELYNPKNEAAYFDTLTIDIDGAITGGAVRDFTNVAIGPKAYLVIGRSKLPYTDYNPPTTGGLPIGTTGNWITVKRGRSGEIMDRVVGAG
ncbi:MAG: lamin tail domain-containing protein, partial [Chitinispirillales bacterium]|nr:lamin tail domain-containing protein [Chitinispirillales bacterium]